jgi:hypothetical protein
MSGSDGRRPGPAGRRPRRAAAVVLTVSILGALAVGLAAVAPAGATGQRAAAASCRPRIASVGPFAATIRQTVVITGSCFGTLARVRAADTPYLRISDLTRDFNACSSRDRPLPDLVTCDVRSWTDHRIVFAGFTGDAVAYSVLAGDHLRVQVWSAPSAAGPAACRLTAGSPATTRCHG